MHALIIDDSRTMRTILKRILVDAGFSTSEPPSHLLASAGESPSPRASRSRSMSRAVSTVLKAPRASGDS